MPFLLLDLKTGTVAGIGVFAFWAFLCLQFLTINFVLFFLFATHSGFGKDFLKIMLALDFICAIFAFVKSENGRGCRWTSSVSL